LYFAWNTVVKIFGVILISNFNEDSYEQGLIELFQNLGYYHYVGYDIERNHKSFVFLLI